MCLFGPDWFRWFVGGTRNVHSVGPAERPETLALCGDVASKFGGEQHDEREHFAGAGLSHDNFSDDGVAQTPEHPSRI